jgi:hypothetical protein
VFTKVATNTGFQRTVSRDFKVGMISEARAVRLPRKERDVLEAPLPVAGDDTARFETSADRASGGGRAQYAVNRQGGWRPAANREPLATALCR